MHLHRRIGIVLIALSVLLSVACLLLSTGWSSGVDLLPTIAVLLKLQLFGEDEYDYLINMQTKYALLACLAVFAVGLLFLIGVFSSNARHTSREQSE